MEKSDSFELRKLRDELELVKTRLTRIEKSIEKRNVQVHLIESEPVENEEDFEFKLPFTSQNSIEFRFGEYGMAWLGNIVLFFGLIFLVNYLQNSGSSLISASVGFASVALVYGLSYYIRESLPLISKLLVFNGHFLFYFFTVRLHFFQENPLIQSKTLTFILLVIVSAGLLYIAFRKKSQFISGISLLMLITSGVFYDSVGIISGMACISAILVTLLYYRFGWLKLTFSFIFIVYLAHLIWLLNNPFMGNNLEFTATPGNGYVYFIATGFIFSFLALIPKKEQISNEFIITSIICNGIGFTFLLAAIVITYFEKSYVPIFTVITLLCIIYAIILKLKSEIKISASMYVLYGFLALSVAIFGIFGLPKSYGLFALQSLLVVSFALWFRSRFMIVMNILLFLLLLIFFIQSKTNNDLTNFSYMLVAFISARIINWKKERLNIKTELVRDLYLVSGFVMTLVAFYHISPPSYITASWILAGLLFFLMSLLIKNIKYRWLAIISMVVSAIRLILVDMASINIGYRVLVFLALAIISITVSILYTKYLIKKKD